MRIYWSLYPLALIYGCAVRFRNKCFDWGILKERRFSLPVICVGNLTVGGTGKTPHTEYLIRLLQPKYKVAVLSRGYKRKTKGFVLAEANTTMDQIGDEPFQMKQKFPNVQVAVDSNRCEGIGRLMDYHPQVIVLDDAFQHRYVRAGLNLLLTDYNRLMTRDVMLPAGRLREPIGGMKRADVVVVTKCPRGMSDSDFRTIREELKLEAHQQAFFSTFEYGYIYKVFARNAQVSLNVLSPDDSVLLLTGIANPEPMLQELQNYTSQIVSLTFPDHHAFTQQELIRVIEQFNAMECKGARWIITTEKDATRLAVLQELDKDVSQHVWALPIEVKILENKEKEFNERICKELK